MSGLEQDAMPLLKPLLEGQKGSVELSPSERLVIARWATKTAFVLNSSSNYRQIVPDDHYTSLASDPRVLPENVWVFAQQHHDPESEFYWLQTQGWAPVRWHDPTVAEENVRKLAMCSYKILLHFRKLMLVVAHWPGKDWVPIIWKGVHVPMFPSRGPIQFYATDPLEFDWHNWREAQGALLMTLGIGRRDGIGDPFSLDVADQV